MPVSWNYLLGEPVRRFLAPVRMRLPSLAGVKPARNGLTSPPFLIASMTPPHFEATSSLFGQ